MPYQTGRKQWIYRIYEKSQEESTKHRQGEEHLANLDILPL